MTSHFSWLIATLSYLRCDVIYHVYKQIEVHINMDMTKECRFNVLIQSKVIFLHGLMDYSQVCIPSKCGVISHLHVFPDWPRGRSFT